MAIGLDQDDRDPYEGTGQTAMEQAQARGDRSYSSIGSMVGSSDDGDGGGSGFSGGIPQPERPSFLERVSSKLGNIFGGIEAPKFDIQKPEFDPTGFYRRTGKQLVDIATPGVKTPLGALPSLLAATKAVPNPVTTGLSLLNYASAKKPEIDAFVAGILGGQQKPETTPAPISSFVNVDQLAQNEIDALSQPAPTGIETLATREDIMDALGIPSSYTPEPAPNMQALDLNPQEVAFFDTNRGVFGSIPNPIDVLTNKNLARQGNIYTSASTGGRGSKRSKGDLLNELSRSIGSAINFSGSNR